MTFLLTGGAACGKSGYAEDIAVSLPGPRYYIAAMRPYGSEGQAKIARHRRLRAGQGGRRDEAQRVAPVEDVEGFGKSPPLVQ